MEGEALGPRNITRIFGQTDVVIPCPYSSPIWKINSISYSSFGLPAVYLSSPVGIVIPIVLIEMNNTAFQCFYMDDTVAEESSVGILTVEIGKSSAS